MNNNDFKVFCFTEGKGWAVIGEYPSVEKASTAARYMSGLPRYKDTEVHVDQGEGPVATFKNRRKIA